MRPDWVVARHAMLDLLPPSSYFSISFQHFVKILTSRSISFSISPTPTYAGWLTLFYPPPRNSNTYVSITFFFCLQKSSASDTMERRIKYLCVGKRLQKYLHGRMKKSGYKNVYIGESFFAYVEKAFLRPQSRCIKHFCIFCIHYLIVIYYI